MSLILIAALDQNRIIGKDNKLLWHLPDDFKRFKQLTSYHKIIMGRLTFESLPKILPHRKHIVITKNKAWKHENVLIAHTSQQALDYTNVDEDVYVIGGAQIYKLFLPYADKLELTHIHNSFENGDTYFPQINNQQWKVVHKEYHTKDYQHLYDFTFKSYIKRPLH